MHPMTRDSALAFFAAVAANQNVEWVPADSQKFGANALRVNGKIYAALTRSRRLLLKLPPARVAELLESKRAERMQSGGRVMKGWITLPPDDKKEWITLSEEARVFVAAEGRRKRR
jgi:hypothetical protein